MRSSYRRAIVIRVPPEVAFAHWERIGRIPELAEALREVTPLGPRHSRWRARIAGVEREWLAELTERIPGRRLAWRSLRGPRHAGSVTFQPQGRSRARVVLQCDFEPGGLIDAAGDVLRIPQRSLDHALASFKRHVERSLVVPERLDGSGAPRPHQTSALADATASGAPA